MLGGYPPAFLRTNTTIIKMPGGYPPAFLFAKSHSKNAWQVSTRLFFPKSHSKNAWQVSTSLFIRDKVILKMPGGYPPGFFFAKNLFLKCMVGIHHHFYSPKSHSKNAWSVSTSLFFREKLILKLPGGYPPGFFFAKNSF